MSEARIDPHLQPSQIAAYLDGGVDPATRTAIQRHLAVCAECRAEVSEVSNIVRTAAKVRRPTWRILVPLAAAAVLLIVWVAPRFDRAPAASQHRDETLTTTSAPAPLAPTGDVDRPATLRWTSVPGASRYRVRLFTSDGGAIWETETADTTASVPDSAVLRPGTFYFWKVEANTGFDRWVSSELTEFTVRGRSR